MPDEDKAPQARLTKWGRVDMASLVEGPRSGKGGPVRGRERHKPRTEPGRDIEIGRLIKGKYRIVEQIGAGGMAVVYRAEEEGLICRDVAIKILKPETDLSQGMLTRFLKEAQAIAKIDHPNVVRLFDIDRTDEGRIYLVMERLVGKPLQQVLNEMREAGEVFTWERLAPLMLQVCRALHAAHKKNIIHRDIKPGNCFCCNLDEDEWHIKVLDFGIAKARANADASADSMETPLTQDGMFIGTPHYAAPEVIRQLPDHQIDGRADIFALGVMMYRCLTGTLPFQGDHQDKLTVLYRTVHERPQPPRERAPDRDIPPQVDALIMRAMEAEPERRFASVVELAEAIRATLRLAADFSGAQVLPLSAVLEPTPRPPGESLAGMSLSAASTPGRSSPPEATPARPTAASSSSASLTAPTPDQFTPKPPGQPNPTGAAPTVIQQLPSRTSLGVIVTLAAMVLGVLALLVLFLYEATSASPPPAPPARTVVPPPRPTESRPPPRAVEPQAPANVVSAKDPPEPAKPPETSPPPPAVQPAAEPDAAAPAEKRGAATDPQQARKRAIKAQLQTLQKSPAMAKCLPLHLGFGDGVYDELPIKVEVNPKGGATATAWKRDVKRRLPKTSDACIFKVIQEHPFPAGEGTVAVTYTLQFD